VINAADGVAPSVPPALGDRFELIVFDWDGTAVPDRTTPVPALNTAMASLLAAGVWLAPVTGTKVEHLERQSFEQIAPPLRGRLRVLTNRGSEVWGYGEGGQRVALYRRVASADEEAQLTRAAEELRKRLGERQLETSIIYDRLNRRKVDLIPLPEWSDPPKARIDELIAATTGRLETAGFASIGEVMRLAAAIARDGGLPDPRVTSDGKYVEIGLTDKSDSIAWIFEHVATTNVIDAAAILIAGDEFGDVGGFAGSDRRMITPDTRGVRVVSVGREPNGVPPGVIHLPGGPGAFLSILRWQLALRTS
jgi:hypothetical protein